LGLVFELDVDAAASRLVWVIASCSSGGLQCIFTLVEAALAKFGLVLMASAPDIALVF